MIKLILGLVVIGAICYVIYKVRNEHDKFKIIQDNTKELDKSKK